MQNINPWFYSCIILFVGIMITIIPIIIAFLKKVELNKSPEWFKEANVFGSQQQRLIAHEKRMEGTLVYWKNKAAAHYRIHMARVLWSLISAVALPVLIQIYNKTNLWSVVFMTGLTTWTGFIVSLAQILKSEEMFRGFRQCESDYYDLARTLLDFPRKSQLEMEEQVDKFIKTVENVRVVGRKVETGSPPSGRLDVF